MTVTREDDDMTGAATAPEQSTAESTMGALSQLLQEANDRGITYQEMADRGVDEETGTRLPRQWYQKLVKSPPVNPPSPAQMHAIAAAIRKPFTRVQEATAKQWLLYEATELSGYDEDVRIIVAHLAGKTAADKRRWRRMIEADEQARREIDE
ncbi:hypothetical protein [Streptomyces mirabilis]|uniref:hypothetical protein n=1 Tax=Streptomyces mirabilis TaxID=68239 RepID=UPI003647019D